jgi:hypothetical protein
MAPGGLPLFPMNLIVKSYGKRRYELLPQNCLNQALWLEICAEIKEKVVFPALFPFFKAFTLLFYSAISSTFSTYLKYR